MAATIVVLSIALVLFLWVLAPLFGAPTPIPQEREKRVVDEALSRSMRQFETDLNLGMIDSKDLALVRDHLKSETAE